MTNKALNLTADDIDNDEAINVAPDYVVNTMNDSLDPTYLSKFIDAEFLDSSPDALTLTLEQLELEKKEKLDMDEFGQDENQGLSAEEKEKRVLCPRIYQYELYQKALKENIIAVLHTGSGKTLIAVMLLKQMALQEKHERLVRLKTKLTFFLVDRVPLVFQQSNVIRANCDVEVKHMCGQMDVDNWSEKKWNTVFDESDVCVMTAQIFLDTLRHGFIKMDRVNLLIFDECHHGTKKHPYNVIMREFYDSCPKEDRPRIFGMTASPMNSKAKVHYSATQLEQNLCSKIHTATDLDALAAFLNPPKEVTVVYNSAPQNQGDTSLTEAIRQKLGYIDRYQLCFKRVDQVTKDLGHWCADRLWKYMLMDLERKLEVVSQDMDVQSLWDEDKALKECADMVNSNVIPDHPPHNQSWFTPKMLKLLSMLTVLTRQGEFCGIIFVETRHTAKAIQLAIEADPMLFEFFNCDILIGHGGREEGDVNMGFKDQNRVIDKFRRGQLNLMIATNVAEEGLDIQPCNVVIRFDFMTTPIGYIQSRGRARKDKSIFAIMVENDNHNQIGTLEHYRQLEEGMKIFCKALPADRNVALRFANDSGIYDRAFDPEHDNDDDYMEDSYTVKSTQALVTKQSAVPLLYRYCGSLPSDKFTALQPSFEITSSSQEGFTCTVRLPSNAAVREVTSKVCPSKIQAKTVAAVNCCKQLHLKKALTDHLLPINHKREILGNMEAVFDENGMIVGSRRRRAMYEKRVPRFWKRPLVNPWEEELEELAAMQDVETDKDLLVSTLNRNGLKVEDISDGIAQKPTDGNGIVDNIKRIDLIHDSSNNNNNNNGDLIDFNDTNMNETCTDLSMATPKEIANAEVSDVEEIPLEDMDGPFDLWVSMIEFGVDQGALDGIPIRRLCMLTWRQFPELPTLDLNTRGAYFSVKIKPFSTPLSVDKESIIALKEFNILMASEITNKEYSCLLGDFPYFLAPLKATGGGQGNNYSTMEAVYGSLDWNEIRQSPKKTLLPLDLESDVTSNDVILVDHANRSQRYFVSRVRKDLTPSSPIISTEALREVGYDNMADYYEKNFSVQVTNWTQPIINVRKISKVMNFLSPSIVVEPKARKSTAAFVIPEFCHQYFISASVFQTWMIIPSVMTRVDALLSAQEAKKRYALWITDTLMLEAYTTPSANMEMDYERLETLGDSFLKFVATCRLYTNFPFSDEGELHCLRIRVICNRALYRAAKRLKIFRYVSSHTFNRRHWRPHGFIAATDTENTLKDARQHTLSDKTLADIVEASLGAAFLSGGLEAGLKCAIAMQIPFDDIQTWSDFYPTFLASREKLPPRAEISALRSVNMPKIKELSNHDFSNPLLVVEALTHASLPNSTAPCYQRLEFLGDAILDFLVIQYLYNKYPEADPGLITDLKDSCVNNHVLGIVCLENGLHKHIIHYSGILVRSIEHTVNEIQQIKDNKEDVGEFWLSLNIPKVLSDVVESMLGAVFVDSEFNWDPVQRLFELWLVPLLDVHVTPELVQVHPVNKLITTLQRLGCEAFMLRNVTTSSTAATGQKCVIFLHDKPFASGSSDNIKVARREAAERALKRVEDEPGLLEKVCNCGVIRDRKLDMKILQEESNDDNYF
ncbi:unnamed protein product [Absidia cylindrospora]